MRILLAPYCTFQTCASWVDVALIFLWGCSVVLSVIQDSGERLQEFGIGSITSRHRDCSWRAGICIKQSFTYKSNSAQPHSFPCNRTNHPSNIFASIWTNRVEAQREAARDKAEEEAAHMKAEEEAAIERLKQTSQKPNKKLRANL